MAPVASLPTTTGPSPQQVTFQPPYTGGWSLMGTNSASIATINQNGMAQCVPGGAAGTVTVQAMASANAATGIGATGVARTATTTLTCPQNTGAKAHPEAAALGV